jgi:hypothetical protein
MVMEHVTSKTLDCYVEFVSLNEAVAAVNHFETNRTGGRLGRLRQRHVEVELSGQGNVWRDLDTGIERNGRWPRPAPPGLMGFYELETRSERRLMRKNSRNKSQRQRDRSPSRSYWSSSSSSIEPRRP